MQEVGKNVQCVLLQAFLDKKLITQDVYEKAKMKILGALDRPDFFSYFEEDRKEETHGHTQNSC